LVHRRARAIIRCMEPEDVPESHRRAPGVYRDRAGWRTLVNCVLSIPDIGTAQRHVIKRWPFDTPLEEMQQWRVEAKPRIEAELQEKIDAAFRALRKWSVGQQSAASYVSLKDDLLEAERRVAEQRATIAKLHAAVAVAQRRAELAEASARELASRAYAGFAAAGARR
jgi:hypothetical protein